MRWCSWGPAPGGCSPACEGLSFLSHVGLRKWWKPRRSLSTRKTGKKKKKHITSGLSGQARPQTEPLTEPLTHRLTSIFINIHTMLMFQTLSNHIWAASESRVRKPGSKLSTVRSLWLLLWVYGYVFRIYADEHNFAPYWLYYSGAMPNIRHTWESVGGAVWNAAPIYIHTGSVNEVHGLNKPGLTNI